MQYFSVSLIILSSFLISYLIARKVVRRLRDFKEWLNKISREYSNFKKNKNIKQNPKINIRIDFKAIFKSCINYLDRLSFIKLIYILLILVTILTLLIVHYNITSFPKVILRGLSILALITIYISIFLYIKHGFKKNLKLETSLVAALIIFCFYLYALQALVGETANKGLFFFMIVAAIIFNLCLYVFIVKYSNAKLAKLFQVLLIYIFALLLGSLVFGLYYCTVFTSEYNSQLEAISSTNNMYKQIVIYADVGLSGFFNFPNEIIIGKVSILQYFWGKLLDLSCFGYIVAEISILLTEKKNNQ